MLASMYAAMKATRIAKRAARACRIDFAITRRPRIGIRLLLLRASRIDPKTERTLHHN